MCAGMGSLLISMSLQIRGRMMSNVANLMANSPCHTHSERRLPGSTLLQADLKSFGSRSTKYNLK